MTEPNNNTGHSEPSVPALGRVNPEEATADILSTIQDAAAQEVVHGAAKLIIATVDSKAAGSEQVDVVREYADISDGLNYPMVNAARKPLPGDQVVAIERPGGMVVLGTAWQAGERDLPAVDLTAQDALDEANNHGHGSHSHSTSTVGNHSHSTDSGGSHNHSTQSVAHHSHTLPTSAGGGRTGDNGGHDHGTALTAGSHSHGSTGSDGGHGHGGTGSATVS